MMFVLLFRCVRREGAVALLDFVAGKFGPTTHVSDLSCNFIGYSRVTSLRSGVRDERKMWIGLHSFACILLCA